MNEQESRVLLEMLDDVALVTLNRPDKRNAMDLQMFHELDETIKKLKRSPQVRVVIVAGKGVDFCSGLDVASVSKQPRSMLSLLWKWRPWRANLAQRVVHGWRSLPVPVICAIHGRCYGGAMQLALGCDFRIGSEDSEYSIMEARWGLIPDMAGSTTLRQIVSLDKALKWTMTAEVIAAQEAHDQGLISEVSENPMGRAKELAAELMLRSPDAVAAIKKLYYRIWNQQQGRLLAKETLYQTFILANKNRAIATKRELGKTERNYQPRSPFW